MTWLSPAAAWWLLLLPALLLLYIFRPRSQRQRVSSLRLWEKLPQVDRPRARLRRPPLSLLLLLQALLILAGSVALIQPALAVPEGKQYVLIVDASGSMQAVSPGGGSAFDRAKDEARRIAAEMRPQDRATLLRAGPSVSTACSACSSGDLVKALDGLRPGAGGTDIRAALSVASGLAAKGGDVETIVISDGGFVPVARENLPANVSFVQVGSAADNRGVTILSARRPPDGSPGYEAYGRVDNAGGSAADLRITALADTVPLPPRDVKIEAGGHASLTWRLPAGTAQFTVSLTASDGSGDAIAADDRAVLFLPADGQYSVPVSAAQPDLYTRAIAGIPGLQTVSFGSLAGGLSNVAFSIIEGRLPPTLPGGSLLLVNPAGDLIPSQGQTGTARPIPATDHPVLSGVDLSPLMVNHARRITTVPSWLQTIVQSDQGTPLILAGERDGRRIAVLAFDPADSNLPKMAAFPLLMANLADWLYPLAGDDSLRPGDSIYLSPRTRVRGPAGITAEVPASGVFADTEQAGVYRAGVAPSGGGQGSPGLSFAVNMASMQESSVRPVAHPELARASGGAAQAGASASGRPAAATRLELWSPLAAVALTLVGLEWLVYCWKRGRM